MDIFSGKYANVEDYLAAFGNDVDVIDFTVTPEDARLITSEFKIGTPFFCAADCAFALSQSNRFKNIEGFHPGTVHNSLNKILEESNQ